MLYNIFRETGKDESIFKYSVIDFPNRGFVTLKLKS